MGIEIRERPAPARLYDAISQVAHALTLNERLSLFNAMNAGKPFAELPVRLRQAFIDCCELLRRGGGVG